jgi:hypothetical protein
VEGYHRAQLPSRASANTLHATYQHDTASRETIFVWVLSWVEAEEDLGGC